MIIDTKKLLVRYNGIGKPLSSDERELLLFALYNESEDRGGIAADAKRECAQIWRKQLRHTAESTKPGDDAKGPQAHQKGGA